MEIITKEYEVFSFEGLEQEDKEQIVEYHCDINVNYDDWYDIDHLKEIRKG